MGLRNRYSVFYVGVSANNVSLEMSFYMEKLLARQISVDDFLKLFSCHSIAFTHGVSLGRADFVTR